jgi:D-sedoheptulose 7-phosphate isomerase
VCDNRISTGCKVAGQESELSLASKVSVTQDGIERLYLTCFDQFEAAANVLERALRSGGKVMFAGNGGSAAMAAHAAGELVGAYLDRERPGLPALALTDYTIITAVANDFDYARTISRQLSALARPGDAFVALSTSGNSENVVRACEQAVIDKVNPVVLTGQRSSKLSELANVYGWPLLQVPADDTPTIQELHLVVLHALCGEIEERMFPSA